MTTRDETAYVYVAIMNKPGHAKFGLPVYVGATRKPATRWKDHGRLAGR